ncbi:hypothetical protein B0F90DRAFT_1670705 [Multifurca ochricompacta]|uniref:Uncharacterized protein n=1 Tax=Multifurca ochricompacta TaxID=376703 RepID=A0AAD4QGQ6_9AGAM|nr:hypothetical protein B0F90DRAFT_1670705 [Multifurca ochricompacta]
MVAPVHCQMACCHPAPPLADPAGGYIYHNGASANAGSARDIQAQVAPAIAPVPVIPENDPFGYRPQRFEQEPPQVFPNPNAANPWVPHLQAPVLGVLEAEGLRRLAGRYLNNPDSYVYMVRMVPGPAGRFRIIITLEMTDLL